MAESTKPEGFKAGRAIDLLNYTAPGDCSDWIMAATGIPSTSPELSLIDEETREFRIKDKSKVIAVMDQHYPLIEKTIEKLRAKMKISTDDHMHMHHGKNSYFMINFINVGLEELSSETVFTVETEPAIKFENVSVKDSFGSAKFDANGKLVVSPIYGRTHLKVKFEVDTSKVNLPKGALKVTLKTESKEAKVPESTTLDIQTKLANKNYDSNDNKEQKTEEVLAQTNFYM